MISPTYGISTWLFLRALGVIYVIAFASLGVQVRGLIGRNGILPASVFLDDLKRALGPSRFTAVPTLCWWSASDRFLSMLCWGGTILASLLIAGVAPMPTLVLLWLSYLSLLNVSRVFLGYQWDVLLLETGFLAIWLAPLHLLPHEPPDMPHPIALWLARWLLFRLMFSSGAVKLRSGDPTWRELTALTYHYETQPLPTPLAWFAHQLPRWIHRASCALMFGVELIVPFLFFAPPPICNLAGLLTIGLMLLIMATGNYGFFNFLAIALSLLTFDDAVWGRFLQAGAPATSSTWPGWALALPAAVLLILSVRRVVSLFDRDVRWPQPVERVSLWLEPLHLVSGYGLFAVMTTTRREIIVEGSNDGTTWSAYEFRWKPGDPSRPPGYCQPHQPRLDWQMWFAALGDCRMDPWFIAFLARVLEHSRPVLKLLRTNPFPDAPPRYIRALLYRYEFTDMAEHRRSGLWWQRERLRFFSPVLTRTTDRQHDVPRPTAGLA